MFVLGFGVVPVFSSVARHSEGPEGVRLRLGHYKLRGEHTHNDRDVVRSHSNFRLVINTDIVHSEISKCFHVSTRDPGEEQ